MRKKKDKTPSGMISNVSTNCSNEYFNMNSEKWLFCNFAGNRAEVSVSQESESRQRGVNLCQLSQDASHDLYHPTWHDQQGTLPRYYTHAPAAVSASAAKIQCYVILCTSFVTF